MKKVLYLSNIEVPYRTRFFNELAKYCDLTVLYERESSTNRDKAWAGSVKRIYRCMYLNGVKISSENAFSLKILKYVTEKYDVIVVGCFNSLVQAMATLFMRFLKIPYFLNVDGEVFLTGNPVKVCLKRLILCGADGFLAAGKKAAESIACIAGCSSVIPYWFSSLSEDELRLHGEEKVRRNGVILVVGQYFNYKGLDVALRAAQMDVSVQYKFVGMGTRTNLFRETFQTDKIPNVELIPFLKKKDLEEEYKNCSVLVLPSRRECWGLVINEAASYGTPIVSTWGSGAAVEFLADAYPQYLARTDDPESLLKCIHSLQKAENTDTYCAYLKDKSKEYSIEKSVIAHLNAMGIEYEGS